MDRNLSPVLIVRGSAKVALRKESVDRNLAGVGCLITLGVALRKESVDRNKICGQRFRFFWSLSARRAWIEISACACLAAAAAVALRKESVDRNTIALAVLLMYSVALRKESVDRNLGTMQIVIIVVGRSPQGERG